MKIKCLIVDDEPIARQIIEQYCGVLPELQIVGSCGNALEAKRFIQQGGIDIVFLDINMPVLDGLSFIRTLTKPPQIILTTAYKEFAHQAFDLAVCDYLLKPFALPRFMMAVDKAKEKLTFFAQPVEQLLSNDHTYIKSEGKIYKINFSEVSYAEASGNNVKIVTDTGVIRPAITFSSLEEALPKALFVRIHRSFIINKRRISHVEGNRVFVGATEMPIGSNYRELFFRELGIR